MITPPAQRPTGLRNLLLMLLGVAVFGSLGTWQLNRSGERRAEIEAFEKAASAEPVGAPATARAARPYGTLPERAAMAPAPGGYLRVRLAGRYAGERQILMDNMTHERQRGYHVLTPLHTAGGIVLVNRGFVPAGTDRSRLPDVSVGGAERAVTGVAAPYFRAGLNLEEPPAGDSWPRRMTYPTAAQLRGLIDERLPDYQLLLEAGEPDGYVRAWRPYGLPPERHLAYAVQWFGLGAAAVGIWLAVTLKRRRKRNEI